MQGTPAVLAISCAWFKNNQKKNHMMIQRPAPNQFEKQQNNEENYKKSIKTVKKQSNIYQNN